MQKEETLLMRASAPRHSKVCFVFAIVLIMPILYGGVMIALAQPSLDDIGEVRNDVIGAVSDYTDQRAQVDTLAAQTADLASPAHDISFFSTENPVIWLIWILLCAFFFFLLSIKRFTIQKLKQYSLYTSRLDKDKAKGMLPKKIHNDFLSAHSIAPQISRTLRIKVRKLSMRSKNLK